VVTPPRLLPYDTLGAAVGSLTNDWDAGVKQPCTGNVVVTPERHWRLVNHTRTRGGPAPAAQHRHIGAGAGVELAAELHHATRTLVSGFDRIDAGRTSADPGRAADRIAGASPSAPAASCWENRRQVHRRGR
jgi:NADH dehydrogenase FAD-containing subunit